MLNFLFHYLYCGILIMATIVVTALLIAAAVLVVKTIKGFIEDIFY